MLALTFLYLTGTFGHVFLPARFAESCTWPCEAYHNLRSAAAPRWHGIDAQDSLMYVDDKIDIVCDWGVAVWVSRHDVLCAFYYSLGPTAYNASKGAVDGMYSTVCVAWGTIIDTEAESIDVPPARIQRLRRLLLHEGFSRGKKQLPMSVIASASGLVRNISETYIHLRPAARAFSRMTATLDPTRHMDMA